jgi:putative intracellular protease/amidase
MRYPVPMFLAAMILAAFVIAKPWPGLAVTPLPQAKESKTTTVAILLFDGVEIIDYSGPWEVFGQAGFKVHTVSEKAEPVTTAFGQRVLADHTFADSPKADILLVPGGGVRKAVENPQVIKWIQDNAKDSSYVMSVCTGAFLLAKAGLLDGLTATTFHSAIDALAQRAPKTKVVYDQRFVDNGKIITTAGLSSGIDGALHLVGKILGDGEAQSTALGLEYTWETDSKNSRAAYADRYLPDFQGFDAKLIAVAGDPDHWELKALISKPASLAEIMELTQKQVVSGTPHAASEVKVTPRLSKTRSELEWSFTDDQRRGWIGTSVAEPSAKEQGKFDVTVRLARAK